MTTTRRWSYRHLDDLRSGKRAAVSLAILAAAIVGALIGRFAS